MYFQKYFVHKQFRIRGYPPTLLCAQNIFWKESHRFLGFRTPLFKQQMFLRGFWWPKVFQCGAFWWPKVSKLQCLGDQKSGGLSRCPGVLILAPMSGRWVGWDKGTLVLTSPWCCMVLLRNACCTVLQARGSVLNVNSDLLSHSSLSHCTAMVF